MDTALITSTYFYIYPLLLLYDGDNVPLIPLEKMFDKIHPEEWNKLIKSFCNLINII